MVRYASLLSLLFMTGCIPVAIGGGAAAAGKAVTEERSAETYFDDVKIHAGIDQKFRESEYNELARNVDIEVRHGRVLLTGVVTSLDAKDGASRLARQIGGVHTVLNEIQVMQGYDTKRIAEDAAITSAIKSRLLVEKRLSSGNYAIDVVNGIAYVFGDAWDDYEMKRALQIARTTKGVKKVISHVEVRPHKGG